MEGGENDDKDDKMWVRMRISMYRMMRIRMSMGRMTMSLVITTVLTS